MNFAEPSKNVLQMGLADGMRVADFGAGTGAYAFAAAGAVGPAGHVYAIDVQEDVLAHLRDAANQRGLKNVEAIWGDIERPGGTKLRDHVLDAAILSNVLFQVEDKKAALAELARVLKPHAKLLVADWAGSYGGIGPSDEQIVPEHEAEELFITAGFHKVKSFRAGPHHYAILFTCP